MRIIHLCVLIHICLKDEVGTVKHCFRARESVIVLCFAVRYFMSILEIYEIIFMGNRELLALLNSSSWCLVMVEWLFLAVPWGCLWFVTVVFPDHTHLLFLR